MEAMSPPETIYKLTPCDKTVVIRVEYFYTEDGSNASPKINLQAYAVW
jgi:hypothetical protein